MILPSSIIITKHVISDILNLLSNHIQCQLLQQPHNYRRHSIAVLDCRRKLAALTLLNYRHKQFASNSQPISWKFSKKNCIKDRWITVDRGGALSKCEHDYCA